MKTALRLIPLALLPLVLGASSAIHISERQEDAGDLSDMSREAAAEAVEAGNPHREWIDQLEDEIPVTPPPRLSGPTVVPSNISFSPDDHLFLQTMTRINMNGGSVPRFLTLGIKINVGADTALLEELSVSEAAIQDVMIDIFEELGFNDVRHASDKWALREEMIIELNQRFNTQSIKDVYFVDFQVY